MNYTEFAEKMLIALYQESENDEPYPEGITLGALVERYGLPDNGRWLDRLAEEWESDGLAKVSDLLEPTRDLPVEIAGRGMRKVEQVFGGKDGVGTILERVDLVPPNALTTEDGDPIVTEDGDYIVMEDQNYRVTEDGSPRVTEDGGYRVTEDSVVERKEAHFSSETWTGRTLNATQRVELAQNIDAALLKVDGLKLDQEKRAQVRALLLAARTLSEAPEPPLDIIRLLFGNVDRILGIAGFFVGIAGLLVGAA